MPTTNIDDLLLGAKTSVHPQTPEVTDSEIETAIESENVPRETKSVENTSDYDDEATTEESSPVEMDSYGNDKESPRTYTEDEVNERINFAVRERLSRQERNTTQPSQAQMQQATKQGFEYNSDSQESWQQQLEAFVEQTFNKISQKQLQATYEAKERESQEVFERKFHNGMSKFKDFHHVVGDKPITDAMVTATRAFEDPAAFLYAAAKKIPQELERISKIKDQYAQMVEIGKLEERLRKSKSSTNTPRPSGKIKDDLPVEHKSDKKPTIEELIAADNAKRLAARRKR